MNGEAGEYRLSSENVDAVRAGCSNLIRHIRNVQSFGIPVTVSINQFITDTDAELEAVKAAAEGEGDADVPQERPRRQAARQQPGGRD